MVGVLARSCDSVMTTGASAQHLEVIDLNGRFPHAGAVTVFTHIRGGDVVRALAGGDGAVMTAGAIRRDSFMVKRGGHPGGGGVTNITLGRGGQVIGGFALSNHTIVTAAASAQYLEVIDRDGRFPHAGAMAVFAYFRCGDVIRALAGGDGAIMTTGAVCRDPFMIKGRR